MKSELFTIARISENGTEYFGINSHNEAKFVSSPIGIKTALSHDDAINITHAMRKAGLPEGVTIKAKSLSQAIRDYSWAMIQAARSTETAKEDKVKSIIESYKPAETEPAKVEEVTPVEDLPEA